MRKSIRKIQIQSFLSFARLVRFQEYCCPKSRRRDQGFTGQKLNAVVLQTLEEALEKGRAFFNSQGVPRQWRIPQNSCTSAVTITWRWILNWCALLFILNRFSTFYTGVPVCLCSDDLCFVSICNNFINAKWLSSKAKKFEVFSRMSAPEFLSF